MKALLKEIADDLSDDQLEAAVDEIDEDGSGKIEFEGNWNNYWNSCPFNETNNLIKRKKKKEENTLHIEVSRYAKSIKTNIKMYKPIISLKKHHYFFCFREAAEIYLNAEFVTPAGWCNKKNESEALQNHCRCLQLPR